MPDEAPISDPRGVLSRARKRGMRRVRQVGRERAIEDAVMACPEALGFPGALAIRNVRVSPPAGRVDVMLLPVTGPYRLVLVEAKRCAAPDAASKVSGQLLMYYAGALSLGANGLRLLRRFASNPSAARTYEPKSAKQLTSGVSPPAAAWAQLQAGEPLAPSDIALFIALDGPPPAALQGVLSVLAAHHGLRIGLVVVREGAIHVLQQPGSVSAGRSVVAQ